MQGFWWVGQLSSLLEGLPLFLHCRSQLLCPAVYVLPFKNGLKYQIHPYLLFIFESISFFFFFFYCHFDVVDGGKTSADNLLNGARSFKSQYLSRGGEEMEEEGAVAEKRTEQISGMWL